MHNTTLTQTLTDRLVGTTVGPVTICEFHWSGDRQYPRTRFVSTRSFEQLVASATPVNDASTLPLHLVFDDEALDLLLRPTQPVRAGRIDGVLMGAEPDAAERALTVLDGLADAEIRQRVFERGDEMTLWPIDAEDREGPLRLPLTFTLSDRYFNIAAVHPALGSNPAVRQIAVDRGRPGWHDHVPASLRFTADVDDATWAVLREAAIQRYGHLTRDGERPPGPGIIAESYFNEWDDPLDPFGLHDYRRTHYDEPVEPWID